MRFVGHAASSTLRRFDRAGGLLAELEADHLHGADFTVFPDSHEALYDETSGSPFPNTEPGKDQKEGAYTEILLRFDAPVPAADLEQPPFDPYLFVEETGYDIHLVGKVAIPGTANPDTEVGRTFLNPAGFPFAMIVPGSWGYPEAGVYVGDAYPKFNSWHHSLGEFDTDWYDHPVFGTRDYELTIPR